MNQRIEILQGDITKFAGAAIVNAANSYLLGGGGVDGAIHRAAGPKLGLECLMLGGCKTGQAKITKGYRLPVRSIIHTVGPVWRGGNQREAELLTNCYQHSLELAAKHQLEALAFPAISCGIYGYPVELAAPIAIQTIDSFLATNSIPEKVSLICFETTVYQAYCAAWAIYQTNL
ncbi:O-acetyl-ADP-ribose deacetylase [Herpetosiphon gulosus]|uniref:O-acetyl-ADP-ribose deacetylase n=1 Tax=Herpetosiphon gulosus TaxID=1973496 RepID=A0ABP9X4Z8_9CHLR